MNSKTSSTEPRITLSKTYSDGALAYWYNSLPTIHTDCHKIPPITGELNPDGSITITSNERIAALIIRTQYDPHIPVILTQTN